MSKNLTAQQLAQIRKALPTLADVHVDQPATDFSIAYMQDPKSLIALQCCPVVRVKKSSDKYYKYGKGQWFANLAAKRGDGAPSAGGGFTAATDSYSCDVYAIHDKIPMRILRNQDQPLDLENDGTRWTIDQILLSIELGFYSSILTTGVFDTDQTGVDSSSPSTNQFQQWNRDGSDPVADVLKQGTAILKATGKKPNFFSIDPESHRVLLSNASIRDRLKAGANNGQAVTPAVVAAKLAELFEVERYLVGNAVYNTAAQGATASMQFVACGSAGTTRRAMLGYSDPNPSIRSLQCGTTFISTESNPGGVVTRRWEDISTQSVFIESEVELDQKVVCTDAAKIFDQCVATTA